MKFKGHATFYIRQGWLTKGLKSINETDNLFYLDKKEQTDILGIGSNMTNALKYWIEVLNLAVYNREDSRSKHIFTDFGNLVWQYDRFIQETDTLWLLHYYLVTNKEKATAWYWLFNEYNVDEFSEDDFFRNINQYVKNEMKVAEKSLKDDYKCILKTYVSKPEEPESNVYSPLSELGIIKETKQKNVFEFSNMKKTVASNILFYVILDQYYKSEYQNNSKEINIDRLLNDNNNIGKVFKLNWLEINEHLDILNKRGLLRVVRTAGLDVINIKCDLTPIEFLVNYYEEM